MFQLLTALQGGQKFETTALKEEEADPYSLDGPKKNKIIAILDCGPYASNCNANVGGVGEYY
eukprot:CAMPEP_0184299514 /NCGR_PEP_ID=MMETSP1049-20130417/10116_1 /TAXON_ID=77928 /ORGANISM="Proteomonas sulcata, Strain CCMP704" /LENGTH=61 /DNA_ID=CAMNT_0026609973 /DNA_START=257 /DNA_END=442 /DNA_ORIENTATION=+